MMLITASTIEQLDQADYVGFSGEGGALLFREKQVGKICQDRAKYYRSIFSDAQDFHKLFNRRFSYFVWHSLIYSEGSFRLRQGAF